MKHMVTNLNDPNALVIFSSSILGNFYFETFLGELEVDSNEQSELLHTTHIVEPHYNIVKYCTKLDISNCKYLVSCSCNFSLEQIDPNIWTLYFDGSRNKEVASVGCLFIDPHGNKTMIACHLDFECTNNAY